MIVMSRRFLVCIGLSEENMAAIDRSAIVDPLHVIESEIFSPPLGSFSSHPEGILLVGVRVDSRLFSKLVSDSFREICLDESCPRLPTALEADHLLRQMMLERVPGWLIQVIGSRMLVVARGGIFPIGGVMQSFSFGFLSGRCAVLAGGSS